MLVVNRHPESGEVSNLLATMVFTAPPWVPQLAQEPPDSIPISEFMLSEEWGRQPHHLSKPPFTCGLSGTEYTTLEVRDRVQGLARSLSKELGWQPNEGSEWDKVIGLFSVNTVRSCPACKSTPNSVVDSSPMRRLIH